MHANDYDDFAQLLDDVYDLIGSGANKIIAGGAKSMFFAALAPYSLATVRAALGAHCVDKVRGRFTPKPADIIEQIEASVLNDGRPGAEEAWAIALRSQDEADTVVWTAECAEAYSLAKPVMALGDEVGARMAFKEAYVRLVAAARAARRQTTWTASIGWDGGRRDQALVRAVVAGLLPVPTIQPLLSGPASDEPISNMAREQLAAIKKMIADGLVAREARLEAEHEQRVAADAAERAEINRKVEAYARRTGIPMTDIRPTAPGAAQRPAPPPKP
ncbi:hypothetical protein SAMN05428959_1011143 [Duganella sp. CF517]|uniref:hypothetical protein n=1 Tax=Duganella sp. CF517 TaxID=1881038 RepID=UPI0008C76759|nr:hypothetical protein [Duganella sp. CF517]SEN31586.1 hypothetical protein SAMN05428959_1011143 [Duganella sp. CF517]